MANGRLEIFANADNTSFNAFAQAHRVAQAQQWNAPYVSLPTLTATPIIE